MINIFNELLLTFSNKVSLFSSKKIERFIAFNIVSLATIIYFIYHISTMDATSFIEVCGVLLTYGGVNSMLLQKDKKIDKEDGTKVD